MSVPIWLLDVDGVLNAVTDEPDRRIWRDWQVGSATADGVRWPITFSPTVAATITRLHDSGVVEVRWLTTWGYDANGELRDLLGLPEFTVAGVPATAPAWWKLPYAREVAREGRPLVWTDDDLVYSPEALDWMRSMPESLAIAPRPVHGLTPPHLELIEEHLDGGRRPAP